MAYELPRVVAFAPELTETAPGTVPGFFVRTVG